MVLVVSGVSLLVHLFSIDYMATDQNKIQFLATLNLFTFFMLLLIISNSVVFLFIGWEGVGMTSYLLINFWSTRLEANKSSLKAIAVNKVGDIALFFGIGLIYYYFQTFDIHEIITICKIVPINLNFVILIAFCLLIAAVAKSAQLGLHTWLPDAMEGQINSRALNNSTICGEIYKK